VTADYDQPIADEDKAIRLNPSSDDHYIIRGDLYAAKGELDRAIVDYDQALKLPTPLRSVGYAKRGWAYTAKGDFDHAIADFVQVMRIDPGQAEFMYFWLGRIATAMGRFVNVTSALSLIATG
jgi:tetratricopeptide (TPR) repeat protein